MAQRVRSVDIGVVWDPNVPEAWMSASDAGAVELWLRPVTDDAEQSDVVLVWTGSVASRMEPPNDEARDGHRLHVDGLAEVLWLGEVDDSELIADLAAANRVHPRHEDSRFLRLRHWVVVLKECIVEVVADSLAVRREPRRA